MSAAAEAGVAAPGRDAVVAGTRDDAVAVAEEEEAAADEDADAVEQARPLACPQVLVPRAE